MTTDITTRRVLDAPRSRVWQFLSDPAFLAAWWGPEGFTNEFVEFDFRPGGEWRFVMRGPDDAQYPIHNRFVEIAEPARLVVDHIQKGHDFRLSIELSDEAGRTLVTWAMRFASDDEAERVRAAVEEANEQNLDRLQASLAKS